MRSEAEPWWRQAKADLETGRQMLVASTYYAASWFAQQAVEKGLKALFIEQQ
jgi:HEPN domain-containing protein